MPKFTHRNRKNRGTIAERELVHLFWHHDWACMRAAGSGSTRYTCPDLICGNGHRKIALECKVTKDKVKYIGRKEVEDLQFFSQMFGAEAWIAVKFENKKWFFLNPEDMHQTEKNYSIKEESAEMKGLIFEELIEI